MIRSVSRSLPPLTSRNFFYEYLPILAFYLFAWDLFFKGLIFEVIATALLFPWFLRMIKDGSKIREMRSLFVFMVFGGILNLFNTKNGIGGLLILMGHFSLAYYIIQHLSKMKWHVLVIIFTYSAYIIYDVAVLGADNRVIFEALGVSRNHGGSVLTILTAFFCFIYYFTYGKVPILVPLIPVYPVLLCDGRSSIFAILVLALVCLIYRKNIKLTIIFLCVLVFFIYKYNSFLSGLYMMSRFAEEGTESARYQIWSSYINNMDFIDLVFGPETTQYPVLSHYGGNPHNAFLNMHRRFGIIVVLYFIVLFFKSIIRYVNNTSLFIPILLAIIAFRMFYDSMFFIGRLDFIFYTMMFYVYYLMKTKNNDIFYNNNHIQQ